MGQNSGKFQPLAMTALGLILLASAPAQACSVIGMVGSECDSSASYSASQAQNPNHGVVNYTAPVSAADSKYVDMKLEGARYNPYKSGMPAQLATAASIAAEKGPPIKTAYAGNTSTNDRDTGKTGSLTTQWYKDGSKVTFIGGEPIALYENAVKVVDFGGSQVYEMTAGTKIATLAPSTNEVLALNKLNGIASGVSSIVNKGTSAFAQIQDVVGNPAGMAQHVQDQVVAQASAYARKGIEDMAAQAGLGSLANLKNMSNFDLVTLAQNARLPVSEFTNGVNAMDLLNGSVGRITDLNAVSGLLNKIPGMTGAGAQLSSIFKGDFKNITNINGSQLAGALGISPDVLKGFNQADIGKLLNGNVDMLSSLGGEGLASFMNLGGKGLDLLSPDQLSGFMGGDLSSLIGEFDAGQLGDMLGISSEYLSSLDSDQLAGLMGGEYGSLLSGGGIGGSFADIGSTFTGAIGGSGNALGLMGQPVGIMGAAGLAGLGGSGGASSLLGGGGGGGGSGRGTAPLVPHGG